MRPTQKQLEHARKVLLKDRKLRIKKARQQKAVRFLECFAFLAIVALFLVGVPMFPINIVHH